MAEPNEERVKQALDKAEGRFWESVAESFPEATHGDLPPDVAVRLRSAMEQAIWSWVGLNVDEEL